MLFYETDEVRFEQLFEVRGRGERVEGSLEAAVVAVGEPLCEEALEGLLLLELTGRDSGIAGPIGFRRLAIDEQLRLARAPVSRHRILELELSPRCIGGPVGPADMVGKHRAEPVPEDRDRDVRVGRIR